MTPTKYRAGPIPHLMTRAEATAIRTAHLHGKPVLALELQEACRVLSSRRERRRFRLPDLSRPDKEHANAVLLYNLGRALGRIEERRAA